MIDTSEKGILKRQDLSSNEKILLLWALSMSEEFDFNITAMAKMTGFTSPTIIKAIKNLEKKKYVKKTRNGKRNCYDYEFFDEPYEDEERG